MAKSREATKRITTDWPSHSQPRQLTVSCCWLAFAVAFMTARQPVASAAAAAAAGAAAATADLLPDARAVVGQVFVYKISDAVLPLAERLQIAEADSDRLPKWLYYSDHARTLTGMPMDDDTGVYVISVRSRDGFNGDESLGALFAITVMAEDLVVRDASSASRSLDQVQLSRTACSREGQLVLATVIIDADAVALTARDRVRIVRTLADTLGLKHGLDDGDSSGGGGGAAYRLPQLDELRLAAAKGDELTFRKGRHSPASLIVAGAGNVPSGRWLPGIAVSWPAGCRSIADSSLKAVERLEATAKDGTLAQELFYDVIGWSVTSFQAANDDSNIGSNRRRHRRQAIKATATSLPDRAPPTSAGAARATMAADVSRSLPLVLPTASIGGAAYPGVAVPVDIRPTAVATSPPASSVIDMPDVFITPPPPPPPLPATGFKPASSSWPSTAKSSPSVSHATTFGALKTGQQPVTGAMQVGAGTTRSNMQPVILQALPEQTVYVGEVLKYVLPEETFYDEEDSVTTSGLAIRALTSAGAVLPSGAGGSHEWITFDPEQLTFVVTPGESHVGLHAIAVEASDRSGATGRARLVFDVKSTKSALAGATQVYTLTLDVDYDQLMSSEAARRDALDRLAAALSAMHGGRRIIVTDVRRGSVVVSYVMLPAQDDSDGADGGAQPKGSTPCNEAQARSDNEKLFNPDGTLRQDALRALPFPVLSLQVAPRGPCVGVLPTVGGPVSPMPSASAKTETTASSTSTALANTTSKTMQTRPGGGGSSSSGTAVLAAADQPPRSSVSVLEVKLNKGKEFTFELPSDLFIDEDGDVRSLDLTLLRDLGTHQEPVLRHAYWVRLLTPSAAPQSAAAAAGSGKQLHGLLWRDADAKAAYVLRAADSGSRETSVRVRFEVTRESQRAIFATVATLKLSLSQPPTASLRGGGTLASSSSAATADVANSVDGQLHLLSHIAAAYGDDGTSHLALLEVIADGHMVNVSWTNTSVTAAPPGVDAAGGIAHRRCPREQVDALSAPIVELGGAGDGRRVSRSFAHRLRPLVVRSFELRPVRVCADEGMPALHVTAAARGDHDDVHDGGRQSVVTADSMVGVVVPVAVIVALLLIAIVVATILVARRRRRSARAVSGSRSGGGTAAIGKGVPVIFDEELDDNAACRQPLVAAAAAEEAKSVPPPAYPGQQDSEKASADAEAAAAAASESEGSASSGGGGDAATPAERRDAEQREPLLGSGSGSLSASASGQGGVGKGIAGGVSEEPVPPYAPPMQSTSGATADPAIGGSSGIRDAA